MRKVCTQHASATRDDNGFHTDVIAATPSLDQNQISQYHSNGFLILYYIHSGASFMNARLYTAAIGIVLCLTNASLADDTVLHVSPTKLPTWDYGGVATGDGSSGNPYATIQEAYAALWKKTGNHQIRLLPGVFDYGHVGMRRFSGGYTGLMQFQGSVFGEGNGAPAWTSVTLMADEGPETVEVVYRYPLGPGGGTPPSPYESCVTGNSTPQGLFNELANYHMKDMNVKDMTITVEGGGVLLGRSWDVLIDTYTFSNVVLYLKTSGVYGNSAIYWHDSNGITNSKIRFIDSRIYYEPGAQNALFAGQSYSSADMPEGLIDGTLSSVIYYWDGADWAIKTDRATGIWESKRNQSSTDGTSGARILKWNENGKHPGGFVFLTNFVNRLPLRLSGTTLWIQ